MRVLAAMGLTAFLVSVLSGCAGARGHADDRAGAVNRGNCRVFVVNKSSQEAVSAVVYVDGQEVLSGSVGQYSAGSSTREVWLQLPLGVHRVRAVIGSQSSEIDVEVTSAQIATCQVIYYDPPGDCFGPRDYRQVAVQQIHPC